MSADVGNGAGRDRAEVSARLGRPSVRTLRMHSFAARFRRASARAIAAGVQPEDVILPAEGMIRGRDGTGLHYLEWPGPRAEPVLLFLHGGGLHAHTFDVTALLLRPAGRLVALDLRGHGDSEWAAAAGYGSEVVASDIEAVLTALGARRVFVVAHSLGGMASLVWAARRPAVLAGLVIVDVGPDIDSAAGRSVSDLIRQRPAFADLEEAERSVYGRLPSRADAAATSGIALNLAWADDGSLTWKHDPAQFRPGSVAGPDLLRQAARRVACPVLVLRGERSRVFSDAGAAELAGLIPGARWERVPGAGHNIQSSNPRGLAEAVIAFLAEHHRGETRPA
jgi:esterase